MLKYLFFPLLLILAACSGISNWSPTDYVVRHGDTLYSIAWRYEVDFQDIAKWNGIAPPYTIHPGQRLTLVEVYPPRNGSTASRLPVKTSEKSYPSKDTYKKTTQIDGGHKKYTQKEQKNVYPSKKGSINGLKLSWMWPTKGKVIRPFSEDSVLRKGVDIAGQFRQPIYASRGGKVVYSGTGLKGYGNLIIIKHDDTYLSAYAFNEKRLVAEGQRVSAGQHIADMGREAGSPLLHFEIRKNGKPIDPLGLVRPE